MNIDRVEWFKAQEALLKLVQVLAPLTVGAASPSLFLNRRFFIPPAYDDWGGFRERHPIRLLTTLQSVHSQVEEIVGPIPQEEPTSPPAPLSKQAKKVIQQVQEAIAALCRSDHFQEPQRERLQEALKSLKPDLERLIAAVAQTQYLPQTRPIVAPRKKKKPQDSEKDREKE